MATFDELWTRAEKLNNFENESKRSVLNFDDLWAKAEQLNNPAPTHTSPAQQMAQTEEDRVRQENVDKLNKVLAATAEKEKTGTANKKAAKTSPAIPEISADNPYANIKLDYYGNPVDFGNEKNTPSAQESVSDNPYSDIKLDYYGNPINGGNTSSLIENVSNFVKEKETQKNAERNQNLADAQTLWDSLTEEQRQQAKGYAYLVDLLADVNSNRDLNNIGHGIKADDAVRFIQNFEEVAKLNGWNLNHLTEIANREYSAEFSERMAEAGTEMGQNHPYIASGMTVPARLVGGLIGAGQVVSNSLSEYPADYNVNPIMDFANASREAIAENLYNQFGGGVKGWGASFTYQTAMSWIDSMASRAILGPFSIYAMGMSAGSEAARNALKNGSSNERALLDGLANGVFEAFFEKHSFDSFDAMKAQAVPGFKDSPKEFAKTVFKNWLKQSGVEASEELFTEAADALADLSILEEHSDDVIQYYKYLEEGYSEKDAFCKVLLNIAGRIGSAALGGFMMGGLSSFVASGLGGNISSQNEQGQTGNSSDSTNLDNNAVDSSVQPTIPDVDSTSDISQTAEQIAEDNLTEKQVAEQAPANRRTIDISRYSSPSDMIVTISEYDKGRYAPYLRKLIQSDDGNSSVINVIQGSPIRRILAEYADNVGGITLTKHGNQYQVTVPSSAIRSVTTYILDRVATEGGAVVSDPLATSMGQGYVSSVSASDSARYGSYRQLAMGAGREEARPSEQRPTQEDLIRRRNEREQARVQREQRRTDAVSSVGRYSTFVSGSKNTEARNVSSFLTRLISNALSDNSEYDYVTFINTDNASYHILNEFIAGNPDAGINISVNKGNKNVMSVRMAADAVNRFAAYAESRFSESQNRVSDAVPETESTPVVSPEQNNRAKNKSSFLDVNLAVSNSLKFDGNEEAADAWRLVSYLQESPASSPFDYVVTVRRDSSTLAALNDFITDNSATGFNIETDASNNGFVTVSLTADAVDGFIRYIDSRFSTSGTSDSSENAPIINKVSDSQNPAENDDDFIKPTFVPAGETTEKSFFDIEEQARVLAESDEKEEQERRGRIAAAGQTAVDEYMKQLSEIVLVDFRKELTTAYNGLKSNFENKSLRNKFFSMVGDRFYRQSADEFFSKIDFETAWQENLKKQGLPPNTKKGRAAFEKNIRISRLPELYEYIYSSALKSLDEGANPNTFPGFTKMLERDRRNGTTVDDIRKRAETAQVVEEDKKQAEQREVVGDDEYFGKLERKATKNLTDRGSAITDEFLFDEMVAIENERRYSAGLKERIAEIVKDDYHNKAVAVAHQLFPELFSPREDKNGKAWGYDDVINHNRAISRRDYAVQEGLTKFREGILAKTKADIRAYFNRKNNIVADHIETRYDEPPEYVGRNIPVEQADGIDIPESAVPQNESQNPVQTVEQSSGESESKESAQEVPEVVKRAEEKANAAKRIETIGKEAYFGQLEAEVEKDIGGDSVQAVRDEMIKRESDARFELRRIEVIDELMKPSDTEDALAIAKSKYSEQLTPAVSDNGIAYGYKGDVAHNRLASAKIDAINNYDFTALRKTVEDEVRADVDSYFADKGVKFEAAEAPTPNESVSETTENISPDSEQTAQEQTGSEEKSKRKTLDETAEELSYKFGTDANIADDAQSAVNQAEEFLNNPDAEIGVIPKKLWRYVFSKQFSEKGFVPADVQDVIVPGLQTMDRMIRRVSAKSPVLNNIMNRVLVDMRDNATKDRTVYLNNLVKRINDLHLSRKKIYDVGIKLNGEVVQVRTSESGVVQAFAEGLIERSQVEKLKLDADKIERAAKTFRDIYDEIWLRTHEVLTALGYNVAELEQSIGENGMVGYIINYMPHFGRNDFDTSGLAKVLNDIGLDIWADSNSKLPNEIAGLTADREPGKRWNPHAMHRNSNKTELDAIGGFENYIGPALDVIFYANQVQATRALEDELRYATSNDFYRKNLDEINSDYKTGKISAAVRSERIDNLKKNSSGVSSCSNFLTQLHEYANHFAGKKPLSDRSQEASFGRRSLLLGQKLIGRVNSNTVGANFGVALTNFIVPFQAMSEISPQHLIAAAWNMSRNVFSGTTDGFVPRSMFLTNRRGGDAIGNSVDELGGGLKGATAKTVRNAYRVAGLVDEISSEIIVRAAYTQELANNPNATESSAMKVADHYARSIMAGRARGEMPTLFNSGNTLVRLYMSFQLETTNQAAHLFQDIPETMRKKHGDEWMRKAVEAWFKYFIGSLIINQITGALSGRKAALDPIFDPIITAFKKKDAGAGFTAALDNLAMNVPMFGNGRYGSTGSILLNNVWGAGEDIAKAITSDKKGSDKLADISWALARPASYFVLPTGGYQIYKTAVGINSYVKGGKYSENGSMLYPVEKSDINVMLFGVNATSNARKYRSGEIKAVPARLVDAMNECAAYGFSRTAFAQLYAKLSGVTDNAEKKRIINQSSLPSPTVHRLLCEAFGVK